MTYTVRRSTGWRTRSGLLAAVGVALAVGSLPAGAAVGPDLGEARSFAALGGSTLTNTGATTMIVGDVGVSPGSAVTGLTPSQVNGGIYVGGTTKADQAHSDAANAYTYLTGMASNTNLTSTDLGGLTLSPGVYTFNSTAGLTGALVLDAGGDSKALFVFQVGTAFTAETGSSVTVINGGADYDESNIYWQCGSSATVRTGSQFLGIIIANQSVTLETGTTLTGIALAINGATTLDSNQVTSPPPPPPVTLPPINLTAVLTGTPVVPAADLEWNDASDNETEFRVYRRADAGAFVQIATVASTTSAATGALVTYNDPVLSRYTIYTYRVTAFGTTAGESVPSNEALVDTGVFIPMNLTAVLSGPVDSPSADLEWTDASDNETEFRVYRRTGAGPAFILIATVPSTDSAGNGALVTYQDPGLAFDETYTYRVTAYGLLVGESVPSNEALVDTGVVVPQVIAPINLTAVLIGTPAIPGADLSWNDASDNENEFRVYRRDGASPDFVQVGTVASTDMLGIDGTVTFTDPVLLPSTTVTYHVTAFSTVDGESAPSNEAILETGVAPPVRWLDLDLGRKRNVIRDRNQAYKDSVRIKGSFSIIDIYTGIPTVMDDIDPRTDGVAVTVTAPGNIILLTIPANDPNWKANKKGVYRWQTHDGGQSPLTSLRIDTRKSEFTLKSRRAEFGSVPVNSIVVTFSAMGATGSDSRTWQKPKRLQNGFEALFTLPK